MSVLKHESRNQQIPAEEAVGTFLFSFAKLDDFIPSQLFSQAPFSRFYLSCFQQGQGVPILGAAHVLKGTRTHCGRPARGAGRLVMNPFSYIPWLPTKGTGQIDLTKLSVLISKPLLDAVPLLASVWQSLLSHHTPLSPPPTLSPLPFSLSQVVTAQTSRKESNKDRSYCSAKRQEKIIKKAGT